MTRFRPTRRSERGQAMPIIVIMAALLLGATSLAVDLSLQTHTRREVQNITDEAALAAAAAIAPPLTQTVRATAVITAFEKMHNDLQYAITGNLVSFATNLVNNGNCTGSGGTCTVSCPANGSRCSAEFKVGGLDMYVSSPPTGAQTSSHSGDYYVEVRVNKSTANSFGAFVGSSSGNPGGHSIAYHLPGNTHFGFALYTDQFAQDGNAGENIQGNVYASQYIQPQSSGQAYICVDGSVVLGSPQAPQGGNSTQATVTPMPSNARSISFLNGKNGAGTDTCEGSTPSGGTINQTSAEGCNISGVSVPSGSYVDDSGYSPPQTVPNGGSLGSTNACVAWGGIALPTMTAPSGYSLTPPPSGKTYYCASAGGPTGLGGDGYYSPGVYTCGLNVDHPLHPGVYEILHGTGAPSNDVTVTQAVHSSCSAAELSVGFDVCLDGVTFELATNATYTTAPNIFADSKINITQSPYCPPAGQRDNPGDCSYPVYAPVGVASSITISKNSTTWYMQGTAYAPTGTMTQGQNSRFIINGQAIVAQWNDQSGFHPNPSITYNANDVAPIQEILRLVE